jgi:hypothetical protein
MTTIGGLITYIGFLLTAKDSFRNILLSLRGKPRNWMIPFSCRLVLQRVEMARLLNVAEGT